MRVKNIVVLLIVVIVVVVIAVVAFGKSKDGSADATVRVGYLPIINGMPHFVAADMHLYEQAGLTVQATPFESSNQIYDALAKGDIDIAPDFSSLPVLINHLKDPGRVKVFSFTKFNSAHPFDEVVVKTDSPIKDIKDLAGKKVGVFPGSTATSFLKDYLSKRGVDISKTQFIQIPASNQLQAFQSGSVDALYVYEPTLSHIIVKGFGRAITGAIYASYIEDSPIGLSAITTSFVTQHPDTARKVIDVYDEAFEKIAKEDAEDRDILMRNLKLDADVAAKVSFVQHVKSTELDTAHFQKYLDILLSLKEIPSQPDLSTLLYQR